MTTDIKQRNYDPKRSSGCIYLVSTSIIMRLHHVVASCCCSAPGYEHMRKWPDNFSTIRDKNRHAGETRTVACQRELENRVRLRQSFESRSSNAG